MPKTAQNNQQGIVLLTAVLVVTLVLIAGGALYYFAKQKADNIGKVPTNAPSSSLQEVPSQASSSGTVTIVSPSSTSISKDLVDFKTDLLSDVDQKISTISANLNNNSPKEYFVYFGLTGSSHASDWETVAGSEIKFDPSLYPGAKGFYFQASLQSDAPDREVYGRIFDTTHSTPIQNSDINFTGLTATFEQSNAMTISPGNVALVVQLHSQNLLGNIATIYNPRIRIVY